MQKALQQMNLKLTQVVSDITGVTGMAILKAILAGERNPQRLAQLRNPHCHHDTDDIAKALQGHWRAEHLFALRQAVELYEVYHQQITRCDQQIKTHLETFGDHSDGQPLPHKAHRHKKRNEPRFDARTSLYRMAGVDLTTIEGIEEGTALVILSEIGTDMTRWPSVKQFCSGSFDLKPWVVPDRVLERAFAGPAHAFECHQTWQTRRDLDKDPDLAFVAAAARKPRNRSLEDALLDAIAQ
jgi:hypothetical protein